MLLLGEKFLIIIGGDDNYVGREEENEAVMSRWARRKVSSQFEEEYLDGRKSFIFHFSFCVDLFHGARAYQPALLTQQLRKITRS